MDTLVLGRGEIEAQAAAMFATTPVEQRQLAAPPTLEEMLVGGSEAATMLSRLFTVEQQPHLVYPVSFSLDLSADSGGGHRRAQRTGENLYVQIVTHAPTPLEASQARDQVAANTNSVVAPTQGRRLQECGAQEEEIERLRSNLAQVEAEKEQLLLKLQAAASDR